MGVWFYFSGRAGLRAVRLLGLFVCLALAPAAGCASLPTFNVSPQAKANADLTHQAGMRIQALAADVTRVDVARDKLQERFTTIGRDVTDFGQALATELGQPEVRIPYVEGAGAVPPRQSTFLEDVLVPLLTSAGGLPIYGTGGGLLLALLGLMRNRSRFRGTVQSAFEGFEKAKDNGPKALRSIMEKLAKGGEGADLDKLADDVVETVVGQVKDGMHATQAGLGFWPAVEHMVRGLKVQETKAGKPRSKGDRS